LNISEKLSLLLSRVSEVCEGDANVDSNKTQLQILKYAEQRAYPAKGRHRHTSAFF